MIEGPTLLALDPPLGTLDGGYEVNILGIAMNRDYINVSVAGERVAPEDVLSTHHTKVSFRMPPGRNDEGGLVGVVVSQPGPGGLILTSKPLQFTYLDAKSRAQPVNFTPLR